MRDFVCISVTYNTSLAGLLNVMLKTTVSLSVGGENQTFFFFFFLFNSDFAKEFCHECALICINNFSIITEKTVYFFFFSLQFSSVQSLSRV